MKRFLTYCELPILIAVPLTLGLCAVFQFDQTALLTLIVVVAALVVFFANFEASRPALRQIMPTVVLAATAAAGRILFAPIPSFKPVSALCILAGVVFGRRSGFMVGALAALVSNFFFGQGPWTPWQMYSWGLVGYCAGVLADHGCFEAHPSILYGYGFASSLLYGFILNSWFIVGFVHPITFPSAFAAYAAGFPFDCVQGISTVLFLAVLYRPWKRKLERIKAKYALTAGRSTGE
ncbi:MAG: ECF transporter S component [Raoultibacter sp.]